VIDRVRLSRVAFRRMVRPRVAVFLAAVLVGCGAPPQSSASPTTASPITAPPIASSPSAMPSLDPTALKPGLEWATVTVERPSDAFSLPPQPSSYGHPLHFPGQAIMADVEGGQNGLVAVGYVGKPGTWTAIAWFSADGRDWQVAQIDSADPSFARSVAANAAGEVVAVGWRGSSPAVWLSGDGETWTSADVPHHGDAPERVITVTATDGGWIAGGSAGPELGMRRPRMWTSTDGRAWQTVPDLTDAADGEIVEILPLEDGYLALGQLGTVQHPNGSVAWQSEDGQDWTRIDDPALGTALVAAGAIGQDGRLIAVGTSLDAREAVVWVSADGRSWERLPEEESRLFHGQKIRMTDVIATSGGWVAVGDESSIQRPTGKSWLSSDGLVWTESPLQPSLEHAEVLGVARREGYLYAVGTFGAPDNFIPTAWLSPLPQ
jgi:photosystem II stability/assembly factor-like uncharacterized protein